MFIITKQYIHTAISLQYDIITVAMVHTAVVFVCNPLILFLNGENVEF